MSSFLWLLLYLAPLLGLTAALFAWFGWSWRGNDLQKRIDSLTAQLDSAQAALTQAKAEAAAANTAPQDPTDGELQKLRDELKSAQSAVRLHQDETAKAREAALALETETTRLLADLENVRAAHASAQEELASLRSAAPAAPPAVEEAAPAKPKRKRSPTAKLKAPGSAPSATLREKITDLESRLNAQQAGLGTLTQEREEWQLRIAQLEEQKPADPAAVSLARRSLSDSDKRLAAAKTEIERLQNQTRVLQRVEEAAAGLTDQPEDDLTQIKGIKKITSEQLRAHGIRTWRQIAEWNEQELQAYSELLAFKNRATREQWQQQARALHEAAHGALS
ncbi:MAG: hypothetical protein J0L73_07055 [Verrucomicrobia bacterium]|nr:hypothetical protein [Verrucomicrobiota bacterium]